MKNKDIHKVVKDSGVYKWQIAERLGIADTTFSRWLRKELSSNMKEAVLTAIQIELIKEKGE